MKSVQIFSFIAIGLVNTSAFAFPTVGDYATYDVKQVISGQTVNGEMTSTITTVNTALETVTVATTINNQAQPAQTKTYDELSELMDLIDQCSAAGGTAESVSAASALIRACHIHQDLNNETGQVSADI